MSSRRMTRDEMRSSQEAAYNNFIATNPEYKQLHELIYQENTSAVNCARLYVDQTIALAAEPDREPKIDHFVEVFAGAIVELGARISYRDAAARSKLVGLVHELQKAVVTDPKSLTGKPLFYDDEQRTVLWTDLPMFWMFCSEEAVSITTKDPTNTPFEKERWKNLTAFWAELTHSRSTDFSDHAFRAFYDALGPHETLEETRPSGFLLQTACIWFIVAADTLWTRFHEGAEHWESEKWDSWTRELGLFRDVDGEAETKTLIGEALAAIESAERGH